MRLVLLVLAFTVLLAGCMQNSGKDCGSNWQCLQAAGTNACTPASATFHQQQGAASIDGTVQLDGAGSDGLCVVRITATGATAPDSATESQKAALALVSALKPSMDCRIAPTAFASFSIATVPSSSVLDQWHCTGDLTDALKNALNR